ncbi:hypothetical protein PR048_007520 [Dryococelus australis]|uniref:Uncharacterized protein n=1 Tax=Dryococelus australis TaxID=614101 RepID=A0ABQ9HUR3_9NEOP|nr:hypothetical protein PR048_007520 [Dryococelus australis]
MLAFPTSMLGSPLVDDRPIMNVVKYKVVSGVVWTNVTMNVAPRLVPGDSEELVSALTREMKLHDASSACGRSSEDVTPYRRRSRHAANCAAPPPLTPPHQYTLEMSIAPPPGFLERAEPGRLASVLWASRVVVQRVPRSFAKSAVDLLDGKQRYERNCTRNEIPRHFIGTFQIYGGANLNTEHLEQLLRNGGGGGGHLCRSHPTCHKVTPAYDIKPPFRCARRWLDYSPTTKVNRVRFSAGSPLYFRTSPSCKTMALVGGFSRRSSFLPRSFIPYSLAVTTPLLKAARLIHCDGFGKCSHTCGIVGTELSYLCSKVLSVLSPMASGAAYPLSQALNFGDCTLPFHPGQVSWPLLPQIKRCSTATSGSAKAVVSALQSGIPALLSPASHTDRLIDISPYRKALLTAWGRGVRGRGDRGVEILKHLPAYRESSYLGVAQVTGGGVVTNTGSERHLPVVFGRESPPCCPGLRRRWSGVYTIAILRSALDNPASLLVSLCTTAGYDPANRLYFPPHLVDLNCHLVGTAELVISSRVLTSVQFTVNSVIVSVNVSDTLVHSFIGARTAVARSDVGILLLLHVA